MENKKDAFIVLNGITEFDIKETEEEAKNSVNYDQSHQKKNSYYVPCVITYIPRESKVEIEQAIAILTKLL